MTSHPDCKVVIPGTFILCGEGGNFCSQECHNHALTQAHCLMQVVKEREIWELKKLKGIQVSIPLSAFGDQGAFEVLETKNGAILSIEMQGAPEPVAIGLERDDIRTLRDTLSRILDEPTPDFGHPLLIITQKEG